jgi:TonB family protein
MVSFIRDYPVFKKFVYVSLSAHIILFLLIIFSPKFPNFGRKRMIHYVNFISLGGGGSSGGGASRRSSPPAAQTSEELTETQVPTRETLRDLTTPPKLEEQSLSSLRHPVENPKRERKQPVEKKAAIQKQEPSAKKAAGNTASGSKEETGEGSGVSLGVGSGSGSGLGFGSEFASQIGLSNFPFTYYLELLLDRISSNWLKSQVSSGTSDELFTTVYFKIYKDGKISVVEIEEKSGIGALDMAAVRAVQSAAPFPPLPYEYDEEYLAIHLRFEHKK